MEQHVFCIFIHYRGHRRKGVSIYNATTVNLQQKPWFHWTMYFWTLKWDSIVKWVSWFKSSLILRIEIKYTSELQFLIKTKDSIFNRKVYTTDERRVPSMAWLGLIETDSILIKEKRKHFSRMLDRVSKECFRVQALKVWVEKVS